MSYLEDLNRTYPVRRTEKEKTAFRAYIRKVFPDAKIETTGDGKNRNIVIGDPFMAKVVCTAHYDTPAASLFPNIMIPRNQVLFYLYQFAPIILMLAAALGGGYLISLQFARPDEPDFVRIFLLLYLAIYYGLFFLMYRTFKNPHNCNDNTSGVAAILSMIDALSVRQRQEVAFILFDNEEKGKKGSKAFFKDHETEMKSKFLVNFDCVANGENVIFIAMKGAEARGEYAALQEAFGDDDVFSTYFYPMKGSQSNSDYKNFPCGVGCMACKRTKSGVLYTPRIHTPRDTIANEKNISFIARRMQRFFDAVLQPAGDE